MNASRLVLALASGALFTPALAAQTVQGRFTSAAGEPVPGARALLRDARGNPVASATTGRDGGFVLRAPGGGRFALAVERIGYALTEAPAFTLGARETALKAVVANPRRVELPSVATAAGRCVANPGSAAETAAVWEEARKALASARDHESSAYQYGVRRFWRQLDPEGRTILRDSVAPAEVTTGTPFVSSPAERVARTGFVENAGSDLVFHVPDAGILLSADFQARHCFALANGVGGMIGLAFQPAAEGETRDVEGTLWLDRASAELRRVEYRYTRLAGMERPADAAGGRMDFHRLPDGRWVVSRWRIRMPVIVAQETGPAVRVEGLDRGGENRLQYRLAAQLEQGGDVLSVAPAGGEPTELAGAGAVRGVVFDSTRLQPLAGARVTLAGAHAVATDADGRFSVAGLPEGDYALAFGSARLDSMGFVPSVVAVSVREGVVAEQELAVPPLAAVWASACADSGQAPGRGVLVGRVHTAAGDPRPGARVAVSWTAPGSAPGRAALATDANGVYRFCTAPAGPPLTLAVDASPSTLTVSGLHVTQGRALRQDVGLPAASAGGRVAGGSASPAQSALSGVVRGAAGQALAGASVRWGEQPAVVTDGQGRFRMRMPPPREYAVSVTHPELGTRATRVALTADAGEVELRPATGASGALTATVQRVVRLATVQAQARNMSLDIQGFYDRQHRGLGLFLTEERLHRNRAGRLSDVLRGVPGLRIMRYAPTDSATSRRRAFLATASDLDVQYRVAASRGSNRILGSGPCWMDVYVDGVQVQSWNPDLSQNLDSFPLLQVQAVEVYRGPSEIPEQYRQTWSGCGVVLLWTKTG